MLDGRHINGLLRYITLHRILQVTLDPFVQVQICAMVLTDEVKVGFFLTVASVGLALFGEPEPNSFVWSDMGGGVAFSTECYVSRK